MYKQITGGIYNISKWADIITVHGITGKESIKSLDDIGCMIFLVSELSASNNLIDKNYTNNCLEISDSIDSIIGCVCQNNISNKYLNIVPGISDNNSKDNMGQTYNNPANKSFADFFVIGRAITSNNNPLNKILNLKNTLIN
jgi:uridine monophosphate synthetase